MDLPVTLTINAFTGDAGVVSGRVAASADRWATAGRELKPQKPLAPPPEVSATEWVHPDVGWGVVLADRDDVSPRDKALGIDAPDPIRDLIAARGGAPVLRYRENLNGVRLRRYFEDGTHQDPLIGLTAFGVGRGRLPLYLLIVGSPKDVPWQIQYSLNRRHHVGRLALPEKGLEHYVTALLSNWKNADSDPTRTVVWSVCNDEMTRAMDTTISQQVITSLAKDKEVVTSELRADAATHAALRTALKDKRPALLLTSSHGKTGPLDDPNLMMRSLGLPVDANNETLTVETLLNEWEPRGAVWYAQACCSAGSDDGSAYEGLLEADSVAGRVVTAVGRLGAAVAPLPTALLGAKKPLRAFVGHVEPTFDWTLLAAETGQHLTPSLVAALYPNLYLRQPVGCALSEYYRGVGELYANLEQAITRINKRVAGARDEATYYRLTAKDRQSLVILGDPTSTLQTLPSQIG